MKVKIASNQYIRGVHCHTFHQLGKFCKEFRGCINIFGVRRRAIDDDVTRYGRHAIYVPGDVILQDGDTVVLSKLGWVSIFHLFLLSFNIFFQYLALAYFAIRYTYRTTVVLCHDGLCDIRELFMYDASQCAWRIAPIRFNNVRLSPLIFIPNIIAGLLRPGELKPLRYPGLS